MWQKDWLVGVANISMFKILKEYHPGTKNKPEKQILMRLLFGEKCTILL
jgi:hypothetical protein